MTEGQYKKLRRWFVFTWVLMFLLVVFSILVFSTSARSKNNVIAGPSGDPGLPGKMGPKGDRGEIGPAGSAGSSVVVTQPAPLQVSQANQMPIQPSPEVVKGDPGVKGDQGPQGLAGKDGREIELRKNLLTGDLEWRYVGDDFWTVLFRKCDFMETCGGD